MAAELKETKSLIFNGLSLEIKYFMNTDPVGKVRYSSEIIFSLGDKAIIDDKTLSRLENKMELLLPASVYSRIIAGILPSG